MSKNLILLISFVLVLGLAGSAAAQTPEDLVLWAEYLFEPADPCADTSGNGYDISPSDIEEGVTLGEYEGFESAGAYHGDLGDYNAVTDEYPNVPYITLPPEAWPGSSANGNVTFEMMLYLDEEWALTPTGPIEAGDCGDPPSRALLDMYGHDEEEYWLWFSQIPLLAYGSDMGDFYFQWEHAQVNDVNGAYFIDADFWHGGLDWAGYNQWVHVEKETWIHWVVSIDDDHGIIRQWVDARPGGCPGDCAFPDPVCESGTFSPGDFTGEASELWLGGVESDPVRGRIDWVRFYKGYTETVLFVPGIVSVSNESPANDEGHAHPDTDLCFQAPRDAICIDPNANLKGPFEYDVYFGTEPEAMVLLADACLPAECNDVMCFDPCAGNLADATTYYWRVDINDLNEPGDPVFGDPVFYEGPLFSFRTWGFADNPIPADGQGDASIYTDLSWTGDDYAVSFNLYFGTNWAEVDDGTAFVQNQGPNTHDPGTLVLDTEYFWRIDEVNGAAVKGDIWSFTTDISTVVDDMDSYASDEELREVWTDYETGGVNADIYIEEIPEEIPDLVYDGNSMRFNYLNNQFGSKVEKYTESWANVADLEIGPDWLASGAKGLSVYFRGLSTNPVDEPVYVVLDDGTNTGMVVYDEPNAIQQEFWHEWNIDLQDPCFGDVDMTSIDKVYLGVGIRGNISVPGGYGDVYFDEIRLYPSRCVRAFALGDVDGDCIINGYDIAEMAAEWLESDTEVPPEEPSRDGLLVEYLFDSDYSDSSGAPYYHGDPSPTGTTLPGGYLHLDGVGYVDIGGDFNLLELFDGSKDFSIVMSFKTEEQSMLFSISRPDPCDPETFDHGQTVYVTHMGGPSGVEASVYYDVWSVGWTWSDYLPALDNEWHQLAIIYDADSAICPPDAWACTPGTLTGLATVYLDGYPPTDEEVEGSIFEGHFDPNVPDAYLDTVRIGSVLNSEMGAAVNQESSTVDLIGDINDVRIYDFALTHSNVLYLAGMDDTYFPLDSKANLLPKLPPPTTYDENDPDIVDFRDYAVLADHWLEGPTLWP